jgi:precorrin-2 dehydrogenase/sirohydrochlorin ferrochelatase
MRYYPIYLDIKNKPCLVIGGGGVGTRKVRTLLAYGAQVTVVSPELSDPLRSLANEGTIGWRNRSYEANDLQGIFLVFGATDDDELNRRIHADAEAKNVLCNIADRPAVCNFILPSIVQRGDLSIAISTSGKSPAFAKKLRKDLETQFGAEYGIFLELMGRIRQKLLSQAHEPEAHKHLFEQLIDGGLLIFLKEADVKRTDLLLLKVLGEGFEMEKLLKKE